MRLAAISRRIAEDCLVSCSVRGSAMRYQAIFEPSQGHRFASQGFEHVQNLAISQAAIILVIAKISRRQES